MYCSVIEHGMTSLSFQTTTQKNEAKQFNHINNLINLKAGGSLDQKLNSS